MTDRLEESEEVPMSALILQESARLVDGDRFIEYGAPVNSMQSIAAIWTTFLSSRGIVHTGTTLSGEDVAHMMALLKITRASRNGPAKRDSYVDGAAYIAIAGECAEIERE